MLKGIDMAGKVRVFLFEKEYELSDDTTVIDALEQAGYRRAHEGGCRGGFCGSCAVIYQMRDDVRAQAGLACQMTVSDGMHVISFVSAPARSATRTVKDGEEADKIIGRLYPEIYSCVECSVCNCFCPQDINVMQYIKHARNGQIAECAELSFTCVACGACSARCPAKIPHAEVAMLARKIKGRYLIPTCEQLDARVKEIEVGKYDEPLAALLDKSIEEIKQLYRDRITEE